jgi:hypothetical protein
MITFPARTAKFQSGRNFHAYVLPLREVANSNKRSLTNDYLVLGHSNRFASPVSGVKAVVENKSLQEIFQKNQ